MTQRVFLSRRNLEVLLSKLNRVKAGDSSSCTIIKHKNEIDAPYMTTLVSVEIVAVEDEVYYRNRPAGMMLAVDEPPQRHSTGLGVNLDL